MYCYCYLLIYIYSCHILGLVKLHVVFVKDTVAMGRLFVLCAQKDFHVIHLLAYSKKGG